MRSLHQGGAPTQKDIRCFGQVAHTLDYIATSSIPAACERFPTSTGPTGSRSQQVARQ
jgi:hypothetical protein